MHRMPVQGHAVPRPTLLPRDHPHHRRLAHHHRTRPRQMRGHRPDHRRRTQQTKFLIMAQCNLDRAFDPRRQRQRHRRQSQCHKALHVAGAAPVQPPLPFRHRPRIRPPDLTFHRNHIRMPRQDHPTGFPRPDIGVKRRFAAILVPHPVRRHAMSRQIAFDPIHQRQIAVTTDRREAHQPIQNIARQLHSMFFHSAGYACTLTRDMPMFKTFASHRPASLRAA